MNKKAILALVLPAFDALHVLNNIDWSHYRDTLLDQCKEEEKRHRGSRGDQKATVTECAKMFAVKRIAEYLTGDKMPAGKDYLHMQRSCFTAAGLVDQYRAEIEKAWQGMDVAALSKLDYCELIAG